MPPKHSVVPGLASKRPRAARADSSDEDDAYLEARIASITADRRRNKTSVPDPVARVNVGSASRTVVVEDQPAFISPPDPPKKARRYKNSVSPTPLRMS